MAAGQASPSGFSYAQAAKGRSPAIAAQTPSSKMTSGAVTPATSAFFELSPGGNWADDVEASATEKKVEPSPAVQDVAKPTEVKDSAVERAKTEEKAQSAPSGTSSPDLMASISTTTKDDDSSAPTTGTSSETTWETKSQVSEPSWIADREKRQAAASQASQKSDTTVKGDSAAKGEKKAQEPSLPAPTPPSYQPAPPPPVNIWAKRAEAAKAKAVAQPSPPKAAASAAPVETSQSKENQRPREDSRKKSASVSNVSRNTESATPPTSEPRRAAKTDQVRINNLMQHGTKSSPREAESPLTTRNGGVTRSSLPNVTTAQPLVKDEISWPTPDLAQDADRKDSAGVSSPDKPGEDDSQSGRRKKPEWEKMVVTPTIKWESQNARGHDGRRPPGSERGRGGIRGRGGLRGGANGAGSNDRAPQRGSTDESSNVTTSGGRNSADREAMPPPPKPNRTTSENASRPTVEPTPDRAAELTDVAAAPSTAEQPKAESSTSEQAAATSNWVADQSSMPRTASPAKVNGVNGEVHDEESIPAPIPRRTSVGTQTTNGAAGENGSRDGPTFRLVPSGHNKENRSFDSYKDGNFTGTPRGKGRGGRGRGRENAHTHASGYSNGDFIPSSGFGVPPSPSAYHTSRGNHYPYPSQSGRGGWSRGNPRAQSIPMNDYYGRSQNPYGPPQLQHVQSYGPPGYDYNGYPMTAMPYQASMDTLYIMGMVSMQLEYYFSIDNLLKDMFLRKNMDSQGFVLLEVVASFNRMKQLNTNRDLLKDVCMNSETVEIRIGEDGKERLRRREGYEQFVLPTDQRNPGAQNDGPKQLHLLERHHAPAFVPGPSRGPQSAGAPSMQQQPPFARRSYDAGFTLNGMAPQFNSYPSGSEAINGDDARGRPAKPPMYGDTVSQASEAVTNGPTDQEPDAFPDDQVSSLTVMAKVKQTRPPHGAATRTFSNGSIDTRSIHAELEKSNGTQTPTPSGDESQANGNDSVSVDSSIVRSPDRGPAPDMMIYWSKDQQAPSETVPKDLTVEPYVQLRHKALDQRSHAATGTCPYDLDVLYQFWSHFLLRNFNAAMYSEFQHYATEDAKTRHNNNGLHSLIKFYDQALLSSNAIRDGVAKDYGKLVSEEPKELEGAAFKQLRAAWRNGAMNLKNRKKLIDVLDPSVRARLDPINGDVTSPVS
ncbi:hypothetical protein LTR86_009716 [Recurvomyces mirabilis]|nr:hypothetical protein LTR86_009716 [Recurvomyces mirabilis]